MEKTEMISEIISLYDKIQDLTNTCKFLRESLDNKGLNTIDIRVVEEGKKQILSQSVYRLANIKSKKSGEIQSFEEWRKIYVWRLPEWMSREQFYTYFDKELRDTYESLKAEEEGDSNE